MQDTVTIKINLNFFLVKADGREGGGEACFGKTEEGVEFGWKY